MSRGELHEDVKKAAERITGKKYCSNCGKYSSIEGGGSVISNRRARWKCAKCMEYTRTGGGAIRE